MLINGDSWQECGIDVLCHFLELSQSSSFVGSSHGSQSSFGQEVAELIRHYQKEEGSGLCLVFVWFMIGEMMRGWELSKRQEDQRLHFLLPALYFQECARKSSNPEEKHRLRKKSEPLLQTLAWRDVDWRELSPERQEDFNGSCDGCLPYSDRRLPEKRSKGAIP
ncbi:hypothetical protein WDW89_12390 [Deltaproteobacteria bacterium TL4]